MSRRRRCVSCGQLVADHGVCPYADHAPDCKLVKTWMKPLRLNWLVYPAGADVILFDGALQICVTQCYPPKGRTISRWMASVAVCNAAGGGELSITDNCRTREQAIQKAEVWLQYHIDCHFPIRKREHEDKLTGARRVKGTDA